tara:strand:- start:916 stop:1224 length:309 start_codon:yes stop_codon:yes gene_type:complete
MHKILLVTFLFFLIGCESLKEGLGLKNNPPNEFLIKKSSPIEKPPTYDLLPPNSKTKKVEKKTKDLKKILDENIKSNNNVPNEVKNDIKSSNIENEILKQLK